MLQHHPADLLAAAPDAIAAAFGTPSRNPHPLADDLATAPLSRLAQTLGRANPRCRPSDGDRVVMGYGYRSTDFARATGDALTTVIRTAFSAQAAHRSFTNVVDVVSYRPHESAEADAALALPAVPESGELTQVSQNAISITAGPSLQLRRYGSLIGFTTEAIVGDEIGSIRAAVETLAACAARTEAALLFAALEANGTMPDGAPVFHVDNGNVVASALDAAALGSAMAALRNQVTRSGNAANLELKHLAVAPDLEFTARKLIHETGLAAQITVATDPSLPAARWYALADPSVSRSLAVLRLRGSRDNIRVEEARRNIAYDGVLFHVTADLGVGVMSRTGIVRGGA